MSNVKIDNLHIAGTACTPEVDFRFDIHRLSLKGESYPENAAAFYSRIISETREYLAGLTPDERVEVHVALVYFNSSSTKMLFGFFEELNQAALCGMRVELYWYHDREDDTIEEFGQELHIDFPEIGFHDIALD
ncbi:MAG: Fe-S oxidoreductase [Proteobacteria bacterium]|nr:Fe-S oxidoreductase [Pseudomonadota bacterium]